MNRTLGLFAVFAAVFALAAGSAHSQLDGSLAQQFHQGTPGINGTLEPDQFGRALAIGDFNGDGHPDLAVGSPFEVVNGVDQAGAIHVFYGNASGFNYTDPAEEIFSQATPGIAAVPEPFDRWGFSLAAGDFDRDGEDDLAVGHPFDSVQGQEDAGAVTVLYGTPSGLSTTDSQIFHQNSADGDGETMPGTAEPGERFGESLVVGDFNGDRRMDLAISIPRENIALAAGSDHGAVQILYGSPDGLELVKTFVNGSGYLHQNKPLSTEALAGERFGTKLVVADFDRDFRDDLAVGIPRDSDDGAFSGAINVFYGADTGLQPIKDVDNFSVLNGCGDEPSELLGLAIAAGDFDGDSFPDLSARSRVDVTTDAVCTTYGSSGGLGKGFGSVPRAGRVPVPTADLFGASLTAGDFDGDGHSDLALYVDGDFFLESGRILVGYGRERGVTSSSQSFAQGEAGIPGTPALLDHFGFHAVAGDITGDGVDDLLAAAHRDEIAGVDDAGSVTIIPGSRPQETLCSPGPDDLCLQDRFRVTLQWETESDAGVGRPVDQGSEDSGMFWFFEPDNWEMLVKVLDGCGVNNRFWVYAAPTTDVAYRLTLTDEATGETVVYQNALGQPAQALADVDAFSAACGVSAGAPPAASKATELSLVDQTFDVASETQLVSSAEGMGTCVPGKHTMCLVDNRFELKVSGQTKPNPVGMLFEGTVAPVGTANSGIFFFFAEDNWEMLVKVLDGCAITGHWWVFAAAATDVGYTLDVRDTVTGMSNRYSNPLGLLATAETDVFALPCE